MSCLQNIHKSWRPISQNTSVQHFTEIPYFNDCVQMTRGRTHSSLSFLSISPECGRQTIHSFMRCWETATSMWWQLAAETLWIFPAKLSENQSQNGSQ